MIEVTRLSGQRFFVNADHIESVEGQADTSLILTNGKRLIVRESIPEIVRKAMEYQGLIRTGMAVKATQTSDVENIQDTILCNNLALARVD